MAKNSILDVGVESRDLWNLYANWYVDTGINHVFIFRMVIMEPAFTLLEDDCLLGGSVVESHDLTLKPMLKMVVNWH